MKKYLITDPLYYTSDPLIFCEKLLHVLLHVEVDYVCLRDKKTTNYEELAKAFMNLMQRFPNILALLHTDIALAKELGAFGVHIPSNSLTDILKAKALGLNVFYSAHTISDALNAQNMGADSITFSPIFDTPNKGKPVGLEKLKEINDKIHINCFALGGIINNTQVQACEEVGVYGFASIRYFLDYM
ncbi:MAG: thiamine phosphate synthase [Sulfurospirillaceae bacterium]|nr:thiamine phosphate synthase [Sulfurospirillaceae bacterium]